MALALFQLTWEGTAVISGAAGVIFSAGAAWGMFRSLKKEVLTKVDLLDLQNHSDARYVLQKVCDERHKKEEKES